MNIVERFINYTKIDTQSDPKSTTAPSTAKQFDLAKVLLKELQDMGISAKLTDKCYVYGHLKKNTEKEVDTVGFIAHMDTAPDMTGCDVKAKIVHYEGGDIVLNDEYKILEKDNELLKTLVGEDIIVTDGTTLLGADDKSGIAIIMDALEYIIENDIEHGDIKICFTPDEEVGRGVESFDVKAFDADYAYTLDGSVEGEISYENFNAAGASLLIEGLNVHPGSAKDKMINSILIANEFISSLPEDQRPEKTEGYEGFYHILNIEGNTDKTTIDMIIRDFDKQEFENKKLFVEDTVKKLNEKYDNRIKLDLKDSYYNMKEIIEEDMRVVDICKKSMEDIGIKPIVEPIRGGTDGAGLSYKGLKCPNIFAGGVNFHSRFEYIPVKWLKSGSKLVVKIVENIMEN